MDHPHEGDMTDGDRARIVGEWVEEHASLVYRFAYRLCGSAADAEDLVQQAFLTAQRKFDQLRDGEKVRPWLLTIVRNNYLKSLRHTKRFVTFESHDGIVDPSHEHWDRPIDSEELQTALNQMPEEFRTPVILFYFEEMSYKDIATHLGIPAGTVMSRLSRGKAYLRQHLVARLGEDVPVSADH
ncbi:MAG: sigma-70 family RNA polymerase sigma factor [Planctomycetaceae bacterium]|nr:sigma-70 family RNA polymerase sigma factor [Planctomycetaceae bacterium]